MKNIRDKNNYLVLCVSCVLVLITICYFGINNMLKGTNAAFGNGCISGCFNAEFLIKYLPNYPDGFDSVDSVEDLSCNKYIISENKFDVPHGYEFVGWNTSIDGSGDNYKALSCVTLVDKHIVLYAQWKEKVIDYGDLNLDDNINNDDYLLLEKHLNGELLLDDNLLLNADVNGDSNIDDIDLDILKQVNLGTNGYTGYLPKKIVPIYELYKDNDVVPDEEKDNNVMGPGSNGYVSGNGSGGSESGNASTGNSNNNTKPSTGTNKPNNNNSNNIENNNVNDRIENIESKTYNFKFFVDDIEYDNTSCTTENSNTCKLILPKNIPSKKGYEFNGWNLDKSCPNNMGITYSVLMENNATYYACFLEVEEKDNIYSIMLVGLLIFLVWVLAIYGIVYLIRRFKKSQIID